LEQARTIAESYKGYVYRLAKRAKGGEAEAQYNLGKAYFDGRGVNQDDTKAITWFLKAAEQNNPDAQYALFRMYAYGYGVEVDHDFAALMLSDAAKNGHAHAQTLMDEARAVAASRKAAQ
jgi:TPR repeat protein